VYVEELSQRGEHRSCGNRELADVLSEKIAARCLDAVHRLPLEVTTLR
jgi:hypothetical protein